MRKLYWLKLYPHVCWLAHELKPCFFRFLLGKTVVVSLRIRGRLLPTTGTIDGASRCLVGLTTVLSYQSGDLGLRLHLRFLEKISGQGPIWYSEEIWVEKWWEKGHVCTSIQNGERKGIYASKSLVFYERSSIESPFKVQFLPNLPIPSSWCFHFLHPNWKMIPNEFHLNCTFLKDTSWDFLQMDDDYPKPHGHQASPRPASVP